MDGNHPSNQQNTTEVRDKNNNFILLCMKMKIQFMFNVAIL